MVNGELAEWYNSVMIRLIIILRVTVAASAQEKASRDLELVSATAIENWTTTLHFDGEKYVKFSGKVRKNGE